MGKRPLFIVAAIGFLLTGCKTDLMTEINLSDLLSGKESTVESVLRVEVSSCQSYEDSTEESRSLIEAKAKVASFIARPKFVNCVRKKMNSYAYFNIPVYINKSADRNGASFAILRHAPSGVDLLVATSANLSAKVEKAKDELFGFTLSDMQVVIKLNNDTQADFKTKPVAVYIDDMPLVTALNNALTIEKGESVVLKLSDVSVASALNRTLQAAPVLLTP